MTHPDSLAAKIDHLKMLLVNATDFAEPVDYLFDVLMLDPRFRKAGKRLKDKAIAMRFRVVLEAAYRTVQPESKDRAQLMAVAWLPEFQLAHGACLIGSRPGMLMYFRDLDMGLSALPSPLRAGEVLFSRFTVYDRVGDGKTLLTDRSGRRH